MSQGELSPGQSHSFLSYKKKKQCTLAFQPDKLLLDQTDDSGVENKQGYSLLKGVGQGVCSMVLPVVTIEFW